MTAKKPTLTQRVATIEEELSTRLLADAPMNHQEKERIWRELHDLNHAVAIFQNYIREYEFAIKGYGAARDLYVEKYHEHPKSRRWERKQKKAMKQAAFQQARWDAEHDYNNSVENWYLRHEDDDDLSPA